MRASYSAMLLVHSNDNLYDIGITSFYGDINAILAPDPCIHLDPSKYNFQGLDSLGNRMSMVLSSS